ncbi:MAG: hypothetical protein ACREA0_12355, partial [bacterium]
MATATVFDSAQRSKLDAFLESRLNARRKTLRSAHVGGIGLEAPRFESLYNLAQERAHLLSSNNSNTLIRVSEAFSIDYQRKLVGGQQAPFPLVAEAAASHVAIGNESYSFVGITYEDPDTLDIYEATELHKLLSDGVTVNVTIYGPTGVDDYRGDI